MPGGDGLTLELIRKIWKEICDPLFNNFVCALNRGYLNRSSRRGIINLIPKHSRDKLNIANWRPIVLLDVDYKIWAKAIANRLEESTYLIGNQQNGFIKNRSIFKNIQTTTEVISYLNKNWQESGVVVTIDFLKCFDRIEFQSIYGTFKYFGFGMVL